MTPLLRWVVAARLAAHGIAHLVGAAVSWRLTTSPDVPYHTSVSEIFTPARFAEDRGRYEPRPWLVRCSDYAVHQGMRIPTRCEVAWQPASGPQPYWRGRVKAIRYDRTGH